MPDDAKEWVTVKVPAADREKAREYRPEGATFGDCLVAGAERLHDSLDSDTPPGLSGLTDASQADIESLKAEIREELDGGGSDPEAIAEEFARVFDYAKLATKTADELQERMYR